LYQIVYSRVFTKELKKVPRHVKELFFDKIEAILLEEPQSGKRLRWRLEGKFSYRVGRGHRAIYKVEGEVVKVLSLEARGRSYRLFDLFLFSMGF
jgi:mRNA-degrading endonuclease RelE of RelBE toxin-antitoxin system